MSPALSPEFAVRDAALAQARAEVLAFALRHGFVERHLCGCGTPRCRYESAETMPLGGLLRAVAMEWGAEPPTVGQSLLRSRLLMFARAFGLLECPCGRDDCPALTADREDARGLVRIVADAWHGRAGNRVPPQGDGEERERAAADLAAWMRETADRYAWNLGLLDALALRLDPASAARFRSVSGAMAASFGRPWPEEARAMAVEAAATWLAPPGEQREVHHVLDAALAVAWHADWTTEDAALLEGAAADACMAILTSGIVHPTVTAALIRPVRRSRAAGDAPGRPGENPGHRCRGGLSTGGLGSRAPAGGEGARWRRDAAWSRALLSRHSQRSVCPVTRQSAP